MEKDKVYLSDRVTKALDDYGILYGDIVENGDGSVNIVGVDEDEWDDVVEAIRDELGLDVLVPDYDHDELDNELIVRDITSDTEDDGAFSRGQGSYLLPKEVTFTASEVALDTDDEDPEERLSDLLSDRYGYCHFGFKYEVKKNENGEPSEFRCYDIEWDTSESLKESKEEDKLETFEDKMDFLAKDEQEAIDGYDKVIAMLDPEADAFVIEQLTKIKVEEEAHKKYLEDVKGNHELEYTEPLEQEDKVNNEIQPISKKFLDNIDDKKDESLKETEASKYADDIEIEIANKLEKAFPQSKGVHDNSTDIVMDIVDYYQTYYDEGKTQDEIRAKLIARLPDYGVTHKGVAGRIIDLVIKEYGIDKWDWSEGHPIESLKEDIIDTSKLNIDEVIGWISEHDTLYSDFKNSFGYEYDLASGKETNKPSIEEVVDWLSEHDQAFEDFKNYFFDSTESLKEGIKYCIVDNETHEVVKDEKGEMCFDTEEEAKKYLGTGQSIKRRRFSNKNENLKEAQKGFVTFLNLECGVLLKENHPEFKDYAVAYDHKHGYYDETYLNSLEGDLEILKESGLKYIKDGVNGTYAILTKVDVQGSMEDDFIQDAIKNIEDGMFIENSVEFLDGEQYNASNVIWSAYKDENGEIIENFVDTSVTEECKKEPMEESRGRGFVTKYKGYSIIDAGDRFVITNENGLNVGETKFGLPVVKGMIDDLVVGKKIKEDLDPSINDKLQALYNEGDVYFDLAKDKDGDDFLIVDGWEDVHKIQKALRPDFEPKDEYDTSVLDELFDNGYAWGFRDGYSKCDSCDKVIVTEPDSYSWVPDFFFDEHEGMIYCGDCVREHPQEYLETLFNNPKVANTILSREELEAQGFEKIDGDYESGWYDRNDSPEEILDKALEEHPSAVFIFSISGQGQFATQFELWGADLDLDEKFIKEGVGVDDPSLRKGLAYLNRYKDAFGYICSYLNTRTHQRVAVNKGFKTKEELEKYVADLEKNKDIVDVSVIRQGEQKKYYDTLKDNKPKEEELEEGYDAKDIIEFNDDSPMTYGDIVKMIADELRSGALDDESYTCTLSDEELEKLAIQYANEYIQDRKGHKAN